MTIGEKIRAARIKKNLTQKQLGDKCGMADSAIRRYESGRGNPTLDTVGRIAEALDLELRDLVLYGEEPDREYENLLDTLAAAGLSVEATGFMDNYYIWHTEAEDPAEDRVELEYTKLLAIVTAASAAAELRKDEFLRKRLDADIF